MAGKELTPPERAQALLTYLTHQYTHNGPITDWAVNELAAVVAHVTGGKAINGG
jgi:hypothetical protein